MGARRKTNSDHSGITFGAIITGVATLLSVTIGGLFTYHISTHDINSRIIQVSHQEENKQKIAEKDREVRTLELFNSLISMEVSDTERRKNKEMAIRLLGFMDKDLGKTIALTTALNSLEDKNIKLIAYRIGNQIAGKEFSKSILEGLNIKLSDNTGKKYKAEYDNLEKPSSGYPELAKSIFELFDGRRLIRNPAVFVIINGQWQTLADKNIFDPFGANIRILENAILRAWKIKNGGIKKPSLKRFNSLSDILTPKASNN